MNLLTTILSLLCTVVVSLPCYAEADDVSNFKREAIEFTPQASLGLHYLIDEKWSIDAEAMFHHISNAGLAERNRGINALGGFIGTYLFKSPHVCAGFMQ